MQEAVTILVTEADLVAATQCYQEMLSVKKELKLIKISVKLPMVLQMDNKGAKDLVNNWSVGGRTRHIDVCFLFLCESKEKNMGKIEWENACLGGASLLLELQNQWFNHQIRNKWHRAFFLCQLMLQFMINVT
jgi:hypothetical protein